MKLNNGDRIKYNDSIYTVAAVCSQPFICVLQ